MSAPEFVRYMKRTRDYYAAQGFERPYRWAHHSDAPFESLSKPLEDARLVLITTANERAPADWQPGQPRPLRRVHSVDTEGVDPQDPSSHFYTLDLSWHKEATHTDDLDSYFPITVLRALVEQGRIGSLAPRFFGVPTEYSQRQTVEADAPEVLRRCREDDVDVALLVPL